MSRQSTCTLSEALSKLAFKDPTRATVVPVAIKDGRWGCCPTAALSGLVQAVQTLCNAGYRADVAIFGRTTVFSSTVNPHRGPLRQLTASECEAYRLFVPGHDTLWEGRNRGNEGEDAFAAHASAEGLDDVRVDLSDLSRLIASHGASCTEAVTPSPVAFTVPEIDAWIGATSHTGVKRARDEFLKDTRAKGLSATFESRWNSIKQNRVGRPTVR